MKGIFLAVVIALIASGFQSTETFSSVVDQVANVTGQDVKVSVVPAKADESKSIFFSFLKTLSESSAFIAFIGVAFTAVLTFWSSRRNSYMTLIVAERAKMLNELRNDLATLLSVLSNEYVRTVKHLNCSTSKPEISEEVIIKAEFLLNKVRLQLVFENNCPKYSRLNKNLNMLPGLSEVFAGGKFRNVEKEIAEDASFLLSREWSRIEIDVKGSLYSLITRRRQRHNEKYEKKDN